MLPAHRRMRSLQHNECSGDAKGSASSTTNKYLFANLILFTSREGDGATPPSFLAENAAIDTSNSSLERSLQLGICREDVGGDCTHSKQILVCRSLIVYTRKGRRGNIALFCS